MSLLFRMPDPSIDFCAVGKVTLSGEPSLPVAMGQWAELVLCAHQRATIPWIRVAEIPRHWYVAVNEPSMRISVRGREPVY